MNNLIEKLDWKLRVFGRYDLLEVGKNYKLFERYEYKYLLKEDEMQDLLDVLYNNEFYLLTKKDKYIFEYKNLYYDTVNSVFFKMWWDELKIKIRIREYDNTKKYLEIKKKLEWKTVKKRESIADFMANLNVMKYELYPNIFTNYSRLTFVNTKLNLRVTFDFNLVFQDYLSGKTLKMKRIIMEVKWAKTNLYAFKQLLWSRQRVNFSKYKYAYRTLKWYYSTVLA